MIGLPLPRRLDDPFFPVTPHRADGWLERPGGHAIYWQDAGAADGVPVVLCHGGPGGRSAPQRRRFFDPARFRIIQFDQRGCGRSTPTGSLTANSLQDTLADIEAIRTTVGVERWVVSGGSWGSTVALAYAQAYPQRCLGLNLTCTWLCRARDTRWWFEGVRSMFPELWAAFAGLVPAEERDDLRRAYARRILGADRAVADDAARRLYLYEQGFMHFESPLEPADLARGADYGRIFIHYAMNDFFLRDDQLLDDAHRIAHLPVEMVVGRYDCCTPPENSWELAQRLPSAHLVVVPAGGHYPTEPAMAQAVAAAPARLLERIG